VISHAGPIHIGPDVVGDVMWSGAYQIICGRNSQCQFLNAAGGRKKSRIIKQKALACWCVLYNKSEPRLDTLCVGIDRSDDRIQDFG
jgi:hypothetical protein